MICRPRAACAPKARLAMGCWAVSTLLGPAGLQGLWAARSVCLWLSLTSQQLWLQWLQWPLGALLPPAAVEAALPGGFHSFALSLLFSLSLPGLRITTHHGLSLAGMQCHCCILISRRDAWSLPSHRRPRRSSLFPDKATACCLHCIIPSVEAVIDKDSALHALHACMHISCTTVRQDTGKGVVSSTETPTPAV